ncbi:MAG: ATP-dependent helicase C-terminal domain-containing protein, partial [Actinomyces dentalis]
ALVFLPGAREVDDVVARLRRALPESVDVLPLHGRLPAAAQDAALAPSAPGRRRVVVSTNVAESSLTVSGVRIVVDSTLTRRPRLDVARAMSGLVTVGVSRSAGIQRAGRAGREGPGAVHRCCTPVDWARSPQAPSPEIASADLTRAALELAVWGAPDGAGLSWIEPPPEAAMRVARRTLAGLGLVEDGAVTALGRAVAALPAEVREARALLVAARRIGIRRAAEAAALLTADLRAPAADLTALARRVREGGAVGRAWRAEAKRLEAAASRADSAAVVTAVAPPASAAAVPPSAPTPVPAGGGDEMQIAGLAQSVGMVSALARPEWIARRRGPAPMPGRSATYATVGGTGVRLPPDSPLASSPWLAVADVDLTPGRGDALIRAAAPIDEELALDVAAPWLVREERTGWVDGRLRSERVRRLGAIELSVAPAGAPSPAAVADAVVAACREQGPGILPWENGAAGLRARLALLHRELGEPWPAMDDDSLLARAGDWLAPAVEQLAARSRRFDLGALDLTTALRALLPWPQAARLDELVPERIGVPSGSRVRVEYDTCGERPVLAVRVQECFGWEETPRVVDGRVPVLLHLLSPARRPVAVTDDLRSFWAGPYQQVRREMRGRYPKHAWPEDPRRPGRPEESSPARRGPRPTA